MNYLIPDLIFDLEKLIISYLDITEDDYILSFYDDKNKSSVYSLWKKSSYIFSSLPFSDFTSIVDKQFFVNYKLHSLDDLPAVILLDGTKKWFKNNLLHRDNDKPAIIYPDNSEEYYYKGLLHREGDNPAKKDTNGNEIYYKHGICHRDNDKPAKIIKEYKNNMLASIYSALYEEYIKINNISEDRHLYFPSYCDKLYLPFTYIWYENGFIHRNNDKPAVIYANGIIEFRSKNKRHRLYGPAVIFPNMYTMEFWIDDKFIREIHRKNIDENDNYECALNKLDYKNLIISYLK